MTQRALATAAFLVLVQAVPAWPADEVARRVHLEGLDCAESGLEGYVAALAAAQQLGYEIQSDGANRRRFEGRLQRDGHRIDLSVDITCSGPMAPGFEAFFGPPGVTVSFTLRAKRGGQAAVSHEATLFGARLRHVAASMSDVPAEPCLGITVRDAASLDPTVRSRLDAATGLVVAEVDSTGPAVTAGLAPWDVLLGIDGVEMTGVRSPNRLLREREPGDEVALLLIRDGQTRRVSMTLGRRTDDGSCATAEAADAPPTLGPAATPALEIRSLDVVPAMVAPGSPFDVTIELAVTLPPPTDRDVELTVNVEILLGGEELYQPAATSVSCRSGATTEVVRHLRAGQTPGSYELRVTAAAGALRDQQTVAFQIR